LGKKKEKWYERPINKIDMRRAKQFLNAFDIKVRFNKHSGWALKEGIVAIYTSGWEGDKTTDVDRIGRLPLNEFWSCVFHEYCHILCGRKGIYKTYHIDYDKPENLPTLRRQALQAELYVDKMAQKLMKSFFPDMRYVQSYRNKYEREWLMKTYED